MQPHRTDECASERPDEALTPIGNAVDSALRIGAAFREVDPGVREAHGSRR
jgi:hypothetical protein